MDVTRANFLEVLPQLETDLEDCEFVAIDFEMTGISLNDRKEMRSTYADIPQERYAKMRPVATRFSIVQMGVAIFSSGSKGAGKEKGGKGKGKGKKKESGTLTVKPYNFYTFAEEG